MPLCKLFFHWTNSLGKLSNGHFCKTCRCQLSMCRGWDLAFAELEDSENFLFSSWRWILCRTYRQIWKQHLMSWKILGKLLNCLTQTTCCLLHYYIAQGVWRKGLWPSFQYQWQVNPRKYQLLSGFCVWVMLVSSKSYTVCLFSKRNWRPFSLLRISEERAGCKGRVYS